MSSLLFAVASWGDRLAKRRESGVRGPFIYALSLGVYCTSWTYFGSVGVASRSGFDFLPIYLGPILVFAVGWRCCSASSIIAKRQNITSIADFIAARYGKSEMLGALVAIIAVVGIIPYISIQLKAVSFSLETMMIAPGCSTARSHTAGRGYRLLRHRRHGRLRDAVRHPPYRHDRASARPDAGDRGRIGRQAARLRRGRRLRHLHR